VSASRGQVGVALIHVESGARLAIHGDQRFPMASVYKLPVALELLTQVSLGQLSLDRQIAIGASDIPRLLHAVATPSERWRHAHRGRASRADDHRERQHGRRCVDEGRRRTCSGGNGGCGRSDSTPST